MAMNEKKLSGGYRCKFVTAPSEALICSLCQFVARDPQLSVCCGTNFCKSCLTKRADSLRDDCPVCNVASLHFTTYPNKMSDREIMKLTAMCLNNPKGCGWKDELSKLEDHLSLCGLQDVQCTWKCGTIVKQSEMADHLKNDCPARQVTCNHCHVTGAYHVISNQHKQQCPKLPLSCANECGSVVVRSAMEEHLRRCPLRKTNCKYYNIGCEAMVTNQDEHDEVCVKEHFHLMRNELVVTKEELVDAKEKLSKVEQNTEELRSDFESKLLQLQEKLEDWKEVSCATITGILPSLGWPNRVAVAGLLLNHCIAVTPVTVQVTNVSEMKARNETFESPPFYTHSFGYAVCLLVAPNGVGYCNNSQLSITIRALNGPYDARLCWPLKGQFTVTLLNQVKNSNHVCQVLGGRTLREPSGVVSVRNWKGFISHKQLFTSTSACNYCINDVMYFQVVYSQNN